MIDIWSECEIHTVQMKCKKKKKRKILQFSFFWLFFIERNVQCDLSVPDPLNSNEQKFIDLCVGNEKQTMASKWTNINSSNCVFILKRVKMWNFLFSLVLLTRFFLCFFFPCWNTLIVYVMLIQLLNSGSENCHGSLRRRIWEESKKSVFEER